MYNTNQTVVQQMRVSCIRAPTIVLHIIPFIFYAVLGMFVYEFGASYPTGKYIPYIPWNDCTKKTSEANKTMMKLNHKKKEEEKEKW